jgi:predicted DNA-binding protein (UPF0251 family)
VTRGEGGEAGAEEGLHIYEHMLIIEEEARVPRPPCPRRVDGLPSRTYFKPRGVPVSALGEVVLSVDELESLRLADLEGLYQEQAAERMRVSRPTFGRIVEGARRKVAEALVEGKALRIEGGPIEMAGVRHFRCDSCQHEWQAPFGTGRPVGCPACASLDFRRVDGSGAEACGSFGRGRSRLGRRQRPGARA